jgi:hypothetical protein
VPLPPEIAVEESFDRVVYRLPRRGMGILRLAGCVLALFGAFPIGMGGFFLRATWQQLRGELVDAPAFAKVFVAIVLLFPVAFVAIGLAMIVGGIMLAAGRAEIELNPRRLISRAQAGPLVFSRGRRRGRVRQITVVKRQHPGPNAHASGHAPSWLDPGHADWSELQAECTAGKPLRLAFGYPQPWLAALADELAERLERMPCEDFDWESAAVGPYARSAPAGTVTVEHETTDPDDIRERFAPPAGCRLVLREAPAGFTIGFPRRGILRATNPFLLIWTFGWCTLSFPFAAVMVALALKGEFGGQPGGALVPLAFMMPFVLVGAGALAMVVHRGTKSTRLTVDGDRLLVVQTGLWGGIRRELAKGDLAAIRVDSRKSTDSDGDSTWTMALLIEPRQGPPLRLLEFTPQMDYVPKAELEWAATLLRRGLGMQSPAAAGAALEEPRA